MEEKKHLGEARLSRGGSVLPWPNETRSSIPTAAMSDCASGLSDSLDPMGHFNVFVIFVFYSLFFILIFIYMIYSDAIIEIMHL